jgi:putative hemolysin
VSVKSLWNELVNGRQPVLTEHLEEPLFVPESTPALRVLGRLRRTGVQVALVLDEYGAIMGLVTLFDLLEGLIGEIAEAGADTPDIAQRADGTWLVDGLLPIDAFEDYFDVPIQPDEEKDYQTMGGFVMMQLGHVPVEGDHFDWRGLSFEVVDMDQLRVDKLLVSRSAAATPTEPEV